MKAPELRTLIPSLQSEVESALEVATTAKKHKKGLGGSGFYADKFHDSIVKITTVEKKVRPHLAELSLSQDELNRFDRNLESIKSTDGKVRDRKAASREFKLLCEASILPKLDGLTASPTPSTEQVLPMDVVKGTRGYLEDITIQINGCYEHQWYDASSVMIRKLAEILIIAVYEKKGVSSEIKDGTGNFHMLSKLVQLIHTKSEWNLARETKANLEDMKKIGDRAAHGRHYVAKKADIDGISSGLRVTVEDLLNHAGLEAR